MEDIEWHQVFETGNTNIDSEHKIFFSLIKKMVIALNGGKDTFYLSRLALEIQKYAEFHFISEENLMINIGYPEIDAHQEKHLKLLEKLNIALGNVELGKETHENLVSFLLNWFKSHTINEDKKIASFL